MYRLIYVSTARSEIGESEIQDILVDSRARNFSAGVTGLLIHDRKRFFQYLEGTEGAVEETFARIAEDPRHRALVILTRGETENRQFPNWEMASKTIDDGISLSEAVRQMVQSCDDGVAAQLIGFAEAREKVA